MRDTLFKYGPIVFGFTVGWLLFNPPDWVAAMGPLGWVINIAICAVLVFISVPFIVLSNLPESLGLETVGDGEVHPELRTKAAELEALGFVSAGAPLKVHVAPSAILLGFVHPSEPVYATVFRTGTSPAKIGYDFISILYDGRGGLTTNSDPAGAALPAGNRGLRQVFPGAGIADLYTKHLEGAAYLKMRGISLRNVSAGMLRQDLTAALSQQREQFLSSPLVNAWVVLWRSATKRVPFVGPLQDQKIAARQIEEVLAGATS